MQFRIHQEHAKRITCRLMLAFVLALAATLAALDVLLVWSWRLLFGGFVVPQHFHVVVVLSGLGIVLGGCAVQMWSFKRDGKHVAHLLGGVEVTYDQPGSWRMLMNITEEMALAAGIKRPGVYVIEDDAINACAAGWEVNDSVICVTQGALRRLTRDQIQGVVAHEFSHILHGDTRLNMRLAFIVYGLQVMFNLGGSLIRAGGSRRKGSIAIMCCGAAMCVAGCVGWGLGRMIQASVSRQREFLADASAVQYTRQVSGIGEALRKISHQIDTSGVQMTVNGSVTALVSHMMLSPPAFNAMSWFSTHPSIQSRIERVYGRKVEHLDSSELKTHME